MALSKCHAVDVPASVATGDSLAVGHLSVKYLWITGVGTGGVFTLQVSPDGTNWYDHTTGINAVGFTSIPQAMKEIRVKTTALVSGTPSGWLTGFLSVEGS
jgi:hypothetical protein